MTSEHAQISFPSRQSDARIRPGTREQMSTKSLLSGKILNAFVKNVRLKNLKIALWQKKKNDFTASKEHV